MRYLMIVEAKDSNKVNYVEIADDIKDKIKEVEFVVDVDVLSIY